MSYTYLVNSAWKNVKSGKTFKYNGVEYTMGATAFASVSDAVAAGVTDGIAVLNATNVTFPLTKNGNSLAGVSANAFESTVATNKTGTSTTVKFKAAARSSASVGNLTAGSTIDVRGYQNVSVNDNNGLTNGNNVNVEGGSTSVAYSNTTNTAGTSNKTSTSTVVSATGKLSVARNANVASVTRIADNNNAEETAYTAYGSIAAAIGGASLTTDAKCATFSTLDVNSATVADSVGAGSITRTASESLTNNTNGSVGKTRGAKLSRKSAGKATITASTNAATVGNLDDFNDVKLTSGRTGSFFTVGRILSGNTNANGSSTYSANTTRSAYTFSNEVAESVNGKVTITGKKDSTIATEVAQIAGNTVNGDITGISTVSLNTATVNGAISGAVVNSKAVQSIGASAKGDGTFLVSDRTINSSVEKAAGALTAENATITDANFTTSVLKTVDLGNSVRAGFQALDAQERKNSNKASKSAYLTALPAEGAGVQGVALTDGTNFTYSVGTETTQTPTGKLEVSYDRKATTLYQDAQFDVTGNVDGYKTVTLTNVGANLTAAAATGDGGNDGTNDRFSILGNVDASTAKTTHSFSAARSVGSAYTTNTEYDNRIHSELASGTFTATGVNTHKRNTNKQFNITSDANQVEEVREIVIGGTMSGYSKIELEDAVLNVTGTIDAAKIQTSVSQRYTWNDDGTQTYSESQNSNSTVNSVGTFKSVVEDPVYVAKNSAANLFATHYVAASGSLEGYRTVSSVNAGLVGGTSGNYVGYTAANAIATTNVTFRGTAGGTVALAANGESVGAKTIKDLVINGVVSGNARVSNGQLNSLWNAHDSYKSTGSYSVAITDYDFYNNELAADANSTVAQAGYACVMQLDQMNGVTGYTAGVITNYSDVTVIGAVATSVSAGAATHKRNYQYNGEIGGTNATRDLVTLNVIEESTGNLTVSGVSFASVNSTGLKDVRYYMAGVTGTITDVENVTLRNAYLYGNATAGDAKGTTVTDRVTDYFGSTNTSTITGTRVASGSFKAANDLEYVRYFRGVQYAVTGQAAGHLNNGYAVAAPTITGNLSQYETVELKNIGFNQATAWDEAGKKFVLDNDTGFGVQGTYVRSSTGSFSAVVDYNNFYIKEQGTWDADATKSTWGVNKEYEVSAGNYIAGYDKVEVAQMELTAAGLTILGGNLTADFAAGSIVESGADFTLSGSVSLKNIGRGTSTAGAVGAVSISGYQTVVLDAVQATLCSFGLANQGVAYTAQAADNEKYNVGCNNVKLITADAIAKTGDTTGTLFLKEAVTAYTVNQFVGTNGNDTLTFESNTTAGTAEAINLNIDPVANAWNFGEGSDSIVFDGFDTATGGDVITFTFGASVTTAQDLADLGITSIEAKNSAAAVTLTGLSTLGTYDSFAAAGITLSNIATW